MRRIGSLVVVLVALLAPLARAQGEKLSEPVKRYLEARKLLYADDLPSAVELFERVVREHPDSDVADDSLYWAGYCRARLPDGRPRAVESWLRLLKRHPASPWLDEAAAALREPARERAEEVLRAALAKSPPAPVRDRLIDGLAALGFEDAIPALEARLGRSDAEAAMGLSRLGAAGAAVLEETLRSEANPAAVRMMAFRGWSRAVVVERSVPATRALALLPAIEKDPLLVDIRRPVRALMEHLRRETEKDASAEDLAGTVRRLRREVAELTKQVEELTILVRKKVEAAGRD